MRGAALTDCARWVAGGGKGVHGYPNSAFNVEMPTLQCDLTRRAIPAVAANDFFHRDNPQIGFANQINVLRRLILHLSFSTT